MDQLTAMNVFVTVVDDESFTRAAERLGISRTMASKHVIDLEARLEAQLLYRTTRRLSLTSTGEVYYQRARQILSEIEEADLEASSQSLMPRGKLRLNVPVSFGISHVAPKLKTYLDMYPDVDVDLTLNDRVVDLVDEGFDLAIRIGRLADSSLIARRIADCRVVACAAPSYLETHGIPQHPEDLRHHVCLSYAYGDASRDWQFRIDESDTRVRIVPKILSNNGDALMAAAIAGAGVIMQPTFIVQAALNEGRLAEILTSYEPGKLGIHAVYPPGGARSARVRSFIDFLVGCFGKRQDRGKARR